MTLHVEETGPESAPLVALVHGSMDRAAGLLKAARRLDTDLRVLRYDRRGYARSSSLGPPHGIEQQVTDLVGLLSGRPAVVVGHSYGGVIALASAARHHDLVVAVGVYEPPLSWLATWPSGTAGGVAVGAASEGASAEEAAERFMRRIVGDRVWERLPEATRAERRAEGPALVGELADLRVQAPFDPADVRCPVLAARGERAAQHHRVGADTLAGWFGCDVQVISTAGHGAHASHPVEFAAFVRAVVAASEVAG